MTIPQALVLVLVIAIWATTSGTDLANNTTLLIILLIALISLAGVTQIISTNRNNSRCPNRTIYDNGTIIQNLF